MAGIIAATKFWISWAVKLPPAAAGCCCGCGASSGGGGGGGMFCSSMLALLAALSWSLLALAVAGSGLKSILPVDIYISGDI